MPRGTVVTKTQVVNIDNMWQCQEEQKKAWSFGNFWKPSQEKQQPQAAKTLATVADKKDGTGTTFGGGGRLMELDKAWQIGACFNCGKKGHIAKFCLEPSIRKKSISPRLRPITLGPFGSTWAVGGTQDSGGARRHPPNPVHT